MRFTLIVCVPSLMALPCHVAEQKVTLLHVYTILLSPLMVIYLILVASPAMTAKLALPLPLRVLPFAGEVIRIEVERRDDDGDCAESRIMGRGGASKAAAGYNVFRNGRRVAPRPQRHSVGVGSGGCYPVGATGHM